MSKNTSVYNCNVMQLSKITNRAGNITIIESNKNVPFSLRRAFYLYDIPGGESRGGHAHREFYQFVVAASGCFSVMLDDGINKKVVKLDHPNYGLLITPGIWGDLFEFSSGAICLVLTSHKYDELDYLRTYNEFKQWKSLK